MLASLFYQEAVAVVGVSRDKNKVGREIHDNVLKFGFKGKCFVINPHTKKINSQKCYPSVFEVPSKLDLAIVAVPSKIVP